MEICEHISPAAKTWTFLNGAALLDASGGGGDARCRTAPEGRFSIAGRHDTPCPTAASRLPTDTNTRPGYCSGPNCKNKHITRTRLLAPGEGCSILWLEDDALHR